MGDHWFIDHPGTAIAAAAVIVLAGLIGMATLPAAQYPDVTPPAVDVTLTYPGADASTLLRGAAEPLEREINGAPHLLYLTSSSSDSGTAVITATFAVGTPPELAVQQVRDRVDRATSQLPEAVRQEGVIVREQSGNILLALAVNSSGDGFDTEFLANYAALHLVEPLKRLPGVAQVQLFGGSDYVLRVWLDEEKLAGLRIPVETVLRAIREQNTLVPAGAVGAAPGNAPLQFRLQTRGRLPDAAAFRSIVLRVAPDGGQVTLGDVARVELGAEEYATTARRNGK